MPKPSSLAISLIEKEKKEKTKSLDLGCCGLTEIPEEVFDMEWLEDLSLSNYLWFEEEREYVKSVNRGSFNRLSEVPSSFVKLKNLKKLRLCGYSTDDWGRVQHWNIKNLSTDALPGSLIYIDLSYNSLTVVPVFNNLNNLRELDLSGNSITIISGFNDLALIKRLNISSNQITEIKGLEKLSNLSSLYISYNQITEIKGLEKLSNLSSLYINSNKITEIKGLEKLSNLSSLYINSNQITEIKGLKKLSNLSSLDISYNKITEIKGLEKLSNLSSLDIGENQITEIKGLDKLSNLSSLDISSNKITEIKGLDKLSNLSSLYIGENQITEIKGLDKLSNLSSLYINSNQITEIKGLDKLSNLSSLYIGENQITEIKGLEKLSNLSSLYINSNQITEIKGLEKLSNLSSLYIGSNQITEIKGLEKLSNLSSLYISNNQITEIKGLEKLSNLSSLDINSNKITEIKGLEKLSNLSSLDISYNQIKEIKGLEKLSNLSSLNIRSNQTTEIKGLEKLSNLSSLYISNNQITEIKGLEKLSNLSSLYISNNQITEIKGLEKLSNLSSLYISYNQIKEIKGLEKLSNLSSLNINANQIREIKGLEKLSNLSSFDISSNQITEIKGLDKLSSLSSLDISSNQITEIKGLEKLSNLSSLYIGSNQITEIKGLEKLSNLSSLYISYNRITEIKGLEKLSNLSTLYISYNQITEIKGLEKLNALKKISLNFNAIKFTEGLKNLELNEICLLGNPLKDISKALLGDELNDNCIDDLRAWWDETSDSTNTEENILIKLQVTGNGNAGKSSIIEALKKGYCSTVYLSTHGIIIEPVSFEVNGKKSLFQAWDFGGQEIYHGTHKLFISSECLMLIVTDYESEQLAEKNEPIPDRTTKEPVKNQPLEHYKELVERQSPGSKIIVVENKVDLKEPANNYLQQKAVRNKLSSFCEVSARTGKGISVLRSMLSEHSSELLHYGMLMPKSWLNVQQYFLENLELPKTDTRKTISKEGFKAICNKYKVMQKAQDSLLTFLHHTGIVYRNSGILKDTIITDQRWALDAIYKPLDRGSEFYDAMRNDYKGRVRAKTIFKEFGKNYSEEEKWLFLHFMQSCGLCFPLKSDKEENKEEVYYVFPQFLPQEETVSVKDLWGQAVDVKTYRRSLNYFDYSRIQQFIVEIGKKTKQEYIWRYGIMVVTDQGRFRVDADRSNNPSVQIQIESAAENEYLLSIIDTLSFPDNKQENIWTLKEDDKETLLDLNALRKKTEEKKQNKEGLRDNSNFEKQGKKEKEKQDSEKRLVEKLEDIKQSVPKRLVISYASEDLAALEALEMSLSNYIDEGKLQVLYDKQVVDGRNRWDDDIEEMFEEADGYLILVSQPYQFVKKKEYIWQREIPIIERRFKDEKIFTWCIKVGPVDYNHRIKHFPEFTNAKAFMPESRNERAQYCLEFAKQIIEVKFIGKTVN